MSSAPIPCSSFLICACAFCLLCCVCVFACAFSGCSASVARCLVTIPSEPLPSLVPAAGYRYGVRTSCAPSSVCLWPLEPLSLSLVAVCFPWVFTSAGRLRRGSLRAALGFFPVEPFGFCPPSSMSARQSAGFFAFPKLSISQFS